MEHAPPPALSQIFEPIRADLERVFPGLIETVLRCAAREREED